MLSAKSRYCPPSALASMALAVSIAATAAVADGKSDVWRTAIAADQTVAGDAPWAVTISRGNSAFEAAVADPDRRRLGGPAPTRRHALDGIASYYWQGQQTASGEPFDKRAMTAAHPTLPFGSRVLVTRVDTGDSVVVRINDRGPFKPGRVIDLSEAAAEQIAMTGRGLVGVRLEVVGR